MIEGVLAHVLVSSHCASLESKIQSETMQPVLSTLPNGASLLRVPMPAVASVTVLALVNAGRRYEPEKWAGISHFIEHMVFKGTQNFANSQELSAEIDNVGGGFNAFTSKEYTGYYVRLASRYLDTALHVVSDMLCTPQLRQEDITREAQVIREEINMYEDMPMRRIGDVYDELLFEGNLEGSVLGQKETISALTRDDFVEYINNWYGFSNVVFVVAGDEKVVGDEALVEKVETALAKGGADRQAQDHQPFWSGNGYGQDKKRIISKETEQAHFVLGMPSFARNDERRYALSLLSTLLGRTMSSRLFTEIRDKRGLCYYVRSNTDFYHDAGSFDVAAGVDPHRIEEAITATKQEILQVIGEQPVTEQELQGAKQNMIGGLLLELEDTQSVAYWYGLKYLLEGKVETEKEVIQKLEKVSLNEVNQVAKDLIREDQFRLALIGSFKPEDITSI